MLSQSESVIGSCHSQSQSLDVVTVRVSRWTLSQSLSLFTVIGNKKGDKALKPFSLYNEFVIMNETCFSEA